MFIVIEGSDGSGKATQAIILKNKLEQLGNKVHYFDFPQYDKFFGKLVGRYLNDEFGNAVKLDPYITSLIYASDRFSVKNELIKAKNEIIIANRYTTANLAHQGSKIIDVNERNKFFEWAEELEYTQYGLPKPDLVIFLHVSTDFSQKLVDMKNKRNYTAKKRDSHESDKNYLQRTVETYKELCTKKDWIFIDCIENGKLMSINEISTKIYEKIKPHLKN